ncbi:hypothetical protein K466DRAFT_575178 [Polyporus arcularius HHB13444]|uniref:Uncharacterized protein n=1 Tax=Polyporus arcularius HHB13444 TaxID=1314778 RepID=A0A5C3PG85_9APHY|nr:hypothetical protein K466DRAFT_575178 [Polyporus arcularius HHB13444]
MGDYLRDHVEAALAAVKDHLLSPEETATKVVAQCNQCIAGSIDNVDVTQEGDTPGLEEFLWSFWSGFLNIAEDDASMHDRLARILAALKAKESQGCDGWIIWGEDSHWGELPLFGPVSREAMNGWNTFLQGKGFLDKSTPRVHAVLCRDLPANDPVERMFSQSRKEWLNINAFLAKLWALDIVDEHFFGIATMRMCLEPLSVQSTERPTADVGGHDPLEELQIEVAATWIKIAGAKMYLLGNPDWKANQGAPGASGGTWDGADGYHPDRWAHWKQIFSEVAQGNWRKNVTEAAQAAVDAMEKLERDAPSA